MAYARGGATIVDAISYLDNSAAGKALLRRASQNPAVQQLHQQTISAVRQIVARAKAAGVTVLSAG